MLPLNWRRHSISNITGQPKPISTNNVRKDKSLRTQHVRVFSAKKFNLLLLDTFEVDFLFFFLFLLFCFRGISHERK